MPDAGRGQRPEAVPDRGGLFEPLGVREPPHLAPRALRGARPGTRGRRGGPGRALRSARGRSGRRKGPDSGRCRRGRTARTGSVPPIARVQLRSGTTSSNASFARRAAPPPENGPEVRAAVVMGGAMHDLQARVRLGGIELEVRESAPGLAAAVVLRLVLSDESRLEHERFEFASGRHVALDPSNLAEKVLDLLSLVAVEVGLHPRAEVARLADVEDALVPTHEAVDAGGVGERVGEPDLPVVRPPTSANGFTEIPEREDPEPAAEVEEPVQDLRARHRIVQRPMGRLHAWSGNTGRASGVGRWGRRATRPGERAWRCRREDLPRAGSRADRGSRSGTRNRTARCEPRRRHRARTPGRRVGRPRSEVLRGRGSHRSPSAGR